jgi:hypothetical protein
MHERATAEKLLESTPESEKKKKISLMRHSCDVIFDQKERKVQIDDDVFLTKHGFSSLTDKDKHVTVKKRIRIVWETLNLVN